MGFLKGNKWLLAGLLLTASLAHASETEVSGAFAQVIWQEGRYDIQHYLRVEDAEAVLARIDPDAELASAEGLTLLSLYIEGNFSANSNGEAIVIETISAEVDDAFVYVYQSAPMTSSRVNPTDLVIRSTLLQDLDPEAPTLLEVTTAQGTSAHTLMAGAQSSASKPPLTTL